jgi:hypothetical protein
MVSPLESFIPLLARLGALKRLNGKFSLLLLLQASETISKFYRTWALLTPVL